MRHASLFAVIAALSSFGCDKASQSKDKDGEADLAAPTATQWSLSDLEPSSNARDLSGEDALSEVLGNEDLYHSAPDDEDAFGKCVKPYSDKIALSSTGDVAVVAAAVDVSKCVDKLSGLESGKGSFTVSQFTNFGCGAVDLSSLDGKTLGELGDDFLNDACKDAATRQSVRTSKVNADVTADIKNEDGAKKPYHLVMEVRSATFGGSMQPCVQTRTDGKWKNDDCRTITRNINKTNTHDGEELPDHGLEVYVELDFSDVSQPANPDAPWNVDGVVKIRVNNWEGTVTYTDENTAPTFELTDGTDTITGKVDDSEG